MRILTLFFAASSFSAHSISSVLAGQEPPAILLNEEDYSFAQFLSDFGRGYQDEVEYQAREGVFRENLKLIAHHNQQQKQQKSKGGGFWLGINALADLRPAELRRGYAKHQSSRFAVVPPSHTASVQRRLIEEQEVLEKLSIRIEPVEDLPKSVDWRTKGVTTPVKSQGMCGSCWAFSSAAVLESHIAIATGKLFELSPQELVSCAPNRQHCGGAGGCTGSTAELAFDLVRDHGMVQEWQFGYQSGDGESVNCTLSDHMVEKDSKQLYRGSVAAITDYAVLPSNNYTVLMNVVAKLGPVTVAVACIPWQLYHSGVYSGPLTPGPATDLDHLVVLEGYGTDEESGEDYWLVRNSWGSGWGENGYIRLKRVGEDECGVDETPGDGTACTLDPDGNEIVPKPQKICGNSGILFDSAIPLGGYLL